MKSLLTGLLLFVYPCLMTWGAASDFWQRLSIENTNIELSIERNAELMLFEIDLEALNEILIKAPSRFKDGKRPEINMPLPDGSIQIFEIAEASIMKDSLQQAFPNIRSYVGIGQKDQSYLRFSVSPIGFHGILFSPQYGTVLFDPPAQNEVNKCLVYHKADYQDTSPESFSCHTVSTEKIKETAIYKSPSANNGFRIFDLALACTGEYAEYHGGTTSDALSAMNATMTKVNAVFEKELSVSFELVNNNHKIIYLNAGTDPYNNFNLDQMITTNTTVCNTEIGTNNYEMGHVFGTSGGGLASIYSVCHPFFKAQGGTGHYAPAGDYFAVNYVCHEFGHQLGANHTHSNNCNTWPATAVEPGSGTTIMAYTGLCPPNIKFSSDDYFHGISIEEMTYYLSEGVGSTCGAFIETGNNPPSIYAGLDYTIPKGTPFVLTASSNDVDNNILTWAWEQTNPGNGVMPPLANSSNGPIFRSYPPSERPKRTFPKMETIVNNDEENSWEVLPTISRVLDFQCTVRDNNGNGGCTEWDNMQVNVDGSAGPFIVNQPNTNTTWLVGSTKTVSWNVANTNNAKVNCQEVNIYLSIDGGYTYPVLLAEEVANTGQKSIVVPNIVGTSNRIKVQASNNIFFDISNQDFTIAPCNNCTNDLKLSVRACLQGALPNTGTLMRDDLRTGNYIPLHEPFSNIDGFNLVGNNGQNTINNNMLNISGNNAIVDWVLLELRSSIDPAFVISCQPALIQRDGEVIDLNGNTYVTFENLSYGSYYVSIRHRNHLGIMTKNAISFNNSTVNIDFTSAQTLIYGEHPQTTANGLQAMWLGNTNQNGEVVYQGAFNEPNQTFFDILNAPTNFNKESTYIYSGYHQSDVNLDGQVIYQGAKNDPSIIFFNILMHPINDENMVNYIIKEQLP